MKIKEEGHLEEKYKNTSGDNQQELGAVQQWLTDFLREQRCSIGKGYCREGWIKG